MSSMAALLVLFPSLGLTAGFAKAVSKGDLPAVYMDTARIIVGVSATVAGFAFPYAFPV